MNTPTTPALCRVCDTVPTGFRFCPTDTGDGKVVHPAELHAWAKGDLTLMAAVRLLDDSRLLDHEWTRAYLHQTSSGRWFVNFPDMRSALHDRTPLSGGERALAAAAVSLAAGLKIDLGETLLALDADAIGSLVIAIGVIARTGDAPARPTPPRINPLAVGA